MIHNVGDLTIQNKPKEEPALALHMNLGMEFGVRKNHGSKMQLRKGESSAAKLRLITILRTIVPLHMLSSFILCCTSAGEHGCSLNDPSRMLPAIHGANTDIQVLLSSLQAAHEYEMAISYDINHSKSMIVNISKFNPLPYSNAHSPVRLSGHATPKADLI